MVEGGSQRPFHSKGMARKSHPSGLRKRTEGLLFLLQRPPSAKSFDEDDIPDFRAFLIRDRVLKKIDESEIVRTAVRGDRALCIEKQNKLRGRRLSRCHHS
jgi:hypothetical protein